MTTNRKERRAAEKKARKLRAEGVDPRLEGLETRHGGRTFELRIYLNTKRSVAELTVLVEALKSSKEIRGPDFDQAIFMLSHWDAEEAKDLWSKVYEASEKAVGS